MSNSAKHAVLICAAVLIAYAIVAGVAVSRHSPVNDEPYHLASAVAISRLGDYRIDPEAQPLWKRFVGLATAGVPVAIDPQSPEWRELVGNILGGRLYASKLLYRTPGTDVDALFFRAHAMMLALTVAFGALLAWTTYRLAGMTGAVAATIAFAAHPMVIGHGPLVTSDMSISFVTLGLAVALARLWRAFMPIRVIAVGAMCGAGLLVKSSALFFVPMVIAFLFIRVVHEYFTRRRSTEVTPSLARVLLHYAAGALAIAAVAWGVLWIGYGFRFAATPDAGVSLDFDRVVTSYWAHERDLLNLQPGPPTAEEFNAWQRPLFIRGVSFAYEHHLLPEAWLTGLVYTRSSLLAYPHFLNGEVLTDGRWWYFPFAVIVKSPLAWLAALAGAAGLIGWRMVRKGSSSSASEHCEVQRAFAFAAGLIVLIFAAVFVTSRFNEGVRHVLPLLPFACIAIGVATSSVWTKPTRRWAVMALGAMLVIESAIAFPNYVAHFNALAGGPTGGLQWLGDSNLDWGQDLPALAAWQREHPNVHLYLAYDGVVDPAHYGITYTNLPGGDPLGPPPQQIRGPGVIAISASLLQGIYRSPDFNPAEFYAPIRKLPLIDVLGGTIYLYEWKPPTKNR